MHQNIGGGATQGGVFIAIHIQGLECRYLLTSTKGGHPRHLTLDARIWQQTGRVPFQPQLQSRDPVGAGLWNRAISSDASVQRLPHYSLIHPPCTLTLNTNSRHRVCLGFQVLALTFSFCFKQRKVKFLANNYRGHVFLFEGKHFTERAPLDSAYEIVGRIPSRAIPRRCFTPHGLVPKQNM